MSDEDLAQRGRVYCGNMYIVLAYFGCRHWRAGTCTYPGRCRAQTSTRPATTDGRDCPLCAVSLARRDFTVMHVRAEHPRAVWVGLQNLPP